VNFKDKDGFEFLTSVYLTFSKREGKVKSGILVRLNTSIFIHNAKFSYGVEVVLPLCASTLNGRITHE